MGAIKYAANMDKNAIELAIKSIGTRGAGLDKDIQLTALSVIAHIDQHNEVSLFTKLYRALPKGSRSNALVAWAIAMSKVEVNLDKDTKKEFPFVCAKGKKTDLVEAAKKPWFDFKKPAEVSEEFDLDKAFSKFMAMIDAKIKAGKVDAESELAKSLKSASALVKVEAATTGTDPVES
jgi:hypothetical protein